MKNEIFYIIVSNRLKQYFRIAEEYLKIPENPKNHEKSPRILRNVLESSRIPKNPQRSQRFVGVSTAYLLGNLGKYTENHRTNLETT